MSGIPEQAIPGEDESVAVMGLRAFAGKGAGARGLVDTGLFGRRQCWSATVHSRGQELWLCSGTR